MAHATHEQDRERSAATATLVALRSMLALEDNVTRNTYYLLPHVHPLEREGMIQALIGLQKPLACIGVPIGDALGVATWPRVEARDAQPGRRNTALPGGVDDLRRRLEATYGTSRLLVIGHEESMVLSLDEFSDWRARYELLFETSVTDETDGRARAAQVGAVMRFLPLAAGGNSGGIGRP